MNGPTNSRVRLPAAEIQDRSDDHLVKNFRISKKMRPFVGRMQMRLEDFDRTNQVIAVQFKHNCQEMKGILAKKKIPEAEADHAIAQALERLPIINCRACAKGASSSIVCILQVILGG